MRTDNAPPAAEIPPAPPQPALQSRPGERWRSHAGPLLVLLLFNTLLFVPLFSGQSYSIVGAHMRAQYPWAGIAPRDPRVIGVMHTQSDHAETFYPLSVFATNALRNGELPMWLPYNFGGIPVMELGLTGLLYPPRLLAMYVFEPIRQHDFLLVTHLLMAGVGMYALLRSWGAAASGALIGALAWEANGHNAFWMVLEHIAIVAAWLPVMLLAATLAVRRLSIRWSIATGVAVAMAVLAGSPHYVFMSCLVLAGFYGAFAVVQSAGRYRRDDKKAALLCISLPLVSLVFALAFTACYWLPLLGWLGDIHRQPLSIETQLSTSFSIGSVASALIRPSRVFGLTLPGSDFSGFAFVGAPAAFFAVFSFLKRSLAAAVGSIALAISSMVVLGVAPAVSALRWAFPYFGTFYPHAFFYLFCFGLAVLSANGAGVVSEWLGRRRAGGLIASAIVLAAIAVEARQLISVFRQVNPRQPVAAEWLFPTTPAITALRNLPADYRVAQVSERPPVGGWNPPVLTGKVPAIFGIRSVLGYESLLPIRVARLWRSVELGGSDPVTIPDAYRPALYHDRVPVSLLEKLSVGALVLPPGVGVRDETGNDLVAGGRVKVVYAGPDATVYEAVRAIPRARFAGSIVSVAGDDQALSILLDPGFDRRTSAIVTEETGSELAGSQENSHPAGTARIVADELNRVELTADTPHTALLVLSDNWAPGWRVYVDGKEAELLRVDYAFRGVVIPGGTHQVTFRYLPGLLIAGLVISLSAIVLTTGGIAASALRSRLVESG
jgi:hypothetical protein